jgi:hypothetical protein
VYSTLSWEVLLLYGSGFMWVGRDRYVGAILVSCRRIADSELSSVLFSLWILIKSATCLGYLERSSPNSLRYSVTAWARKSFLAFWVSILQYRFSRKLFPWGSEVTLPGSVLLSVSLTFCWLFSVPVRELECSSGAMVSESLIVLQAQLCKAIRMWGLGVLRSVI